jgi:hypothetical protein
LEIGLLGLVSGMPPFEPCFPAPQARTAAAPARLHAAFSGPAAATTTTPALAALRRPFPSFSDPLFRSVGSCIVSALCALCAALMRVAHRQEQRRRRPQAQRGSRQCSRLGHPEGRWRPCGARARGPCQRLRNSSAADASSSSSNRGGYGRRKAIMAAWAAAARHRYT